MSSRRMKSRKSAVISRKQRNAMKAIARKVVDEEIEDKSFVYTVENKQLLHNKPDYVYKFLNDITIGANDGDQAVSNAANRDVRVGDQISLKNINIRFWMSNKGDRPNVMYKAILYWYPVGTVPNDALIYKTQTNKMLDRYNDKQIQIIDTFIVQSKQSYAETGNEHSYIHTLNKSYKNKKITYDGLTGLPKGKDLGFAVVCYDAYGTLQTDNIASYAYQSLITFQDA